MSVTGMFVDCTIQNRAMNNETFNFGCSGIEVVFNYFNYRLPFVAGGLLPVDDIGK